MTTEFQVEVLQYLLPDGRRRLETTLLPVAVAPLYIQMMNSGHRFEAEMLRTGDISVSIYCPEKEEDVDIELIPNGPEVQQALVKMLKRGLWRTP